jgi:hypothetical protein
MIKMTYDSLDHVRNQIVAAFAAAQPSRFAELANLPEPAEGEERHLKFTDHCSAKAMHPAPLDVQLIAGLPHIAFQAVLCFW